MRTSWRRAATAFGTAVLMVTGVVVGSGGARADAQSGPPPMIILVMDEIVSPTVLDVVAEVVPGSEVATAFVRYGTTAAYGLTSVRKDIGPGEAPVKLTWELAGLHRSTTYHFQVVAESAAGKITGRDTTVPMPATSLTPPSNPKVPPITAPSEPVGNADGVRAVPVSTANVSFSMLNDVSCPSTTFCLAVGVAGSSGAHWRPLAERFDGRAFDVLASPSPWGAQLVGVACRTARFCLAVGSDGNDTFSERWNGTGWSVISTPSPRLDGGDLLAKVACVSTSDCFSIGVENGGTKNALPLVERWNGTTWSLVATPVVPSPVLESISCPSATSCFVVGIKDAAAGLGRPLIEHWNGRAFVLSPAPSPGGQLFSVACGGPASCVAVGNSGGGQALLLYLAGGSWHTSPPPPLLSLGATACVSPSSCFAVGGDTAHWNGRTWALGRPAAAYGVVATGAGGADLSGLSCPTSAECVGVGGLVRPATGPGRGNEHAIGDVITVGG